MTYSLPLRRTILQSALRFLMDALTFIFLAFSYQPLAVSDEILLIPAANS
jgi:hypothetical protein